MGINYIIQAGIVDITSDSPKEDDVFLVDTNVWYWMTYTRASLSDRPPAQYQTTNYPRYTNAALAAGAQIYQSGLSLAELTHLIEKAEREIYEKTNRRISPKEYRHNFHAERTRVVDEIQSAWGQVVSMADPIVASIDGEMTDASLARLKTEKVDGYDLFILESMKTNGVIQVITDDGDFASVAGIQVFTANRNVIAAARAQEKLKTR